MSRTQAEIDELIANGERLVREAKDALARSERLFAEHGIKPGEALEYVRRHGGEAAVQEIEAQVKAEIQLIEDEAQRRRMHTPKTRAPGQRPRIRTNMV
jgi:hypothetical protein